MGGRQFLLFLLDTSCGQISQGLEGFGPQKITPQTPQEAFGCVRGKLRSFSPQ